METAEATSASPVQADAVGDRSVASWPHTLIVLLVLAVWAYFGKLRADHLRSADSVDRIRLYVRTMSFEWLLLVFVLAGLWMRKTSFRVVLGERWSSVRSFAQDLGLGIVFLFCSLVVSTVFLSRGHGSVDPAVRYLLPLTIAEKSLWILLSLTAGICEEAIYRGYLQQQFIAWTGSAAAGIILQALIFGTGHVYQGFQRTIPIAMLGLFLGVLTHWRKTVRPGMITHTLQDVLAVFAR